MIPVHHMVEVFPGLPDDEYEALRESIREHGQAVPAVTWGGQLIDGRHRARACRELGVVLRTEDAPEHVRTEREALDYMMALNAKRRQMDATDRAFAAAAYRRKLKEIGRQRMVEAGAEGGRKSAPGRPAQPASDSLGDARKGLTPGSNPFSEPVVQASPETVGEAKRLRAEHGPPGKGLTPGPDLSPPPIATNPPPPQPKRFDAREESAKVFDVGVQSVDRADKIESAAPEVKAWVRKGNGNLKLGAQIVKVTDDPARQAEIVAGNPRPPQVRSALAQLKRDQRAAEILEQTTAEIEGVDLRLCTVEEMLADDRIAGTALVHADPPWAYDGHIRGAADGHYSTDHQKRVFVDALNAAYDRAAEHAVCLVWVTAPHMASWMHAAEQHRLRWAEHTPMYWIKGKVDSLEIKPTTGMGKLARGAVEILLVYTKGSPILLQKAALPNLYIGEPTGRHSEKPMDWLIHLVEALTPKGGLVLDLYAGWAPLAQACHVLGRLYVGAEKDEARHRQAVADIAATAAQEAA